MNINTVAIYDNNDENLGDFFDSCVDTIDKEAPDIFCALNLKKITSEEVSAINISDYLSEVNQQNFIFLGFIHGTKTAMVMNCSEELVSTTLNHYIFSNAFIYTFSCYTGCDLADALLNNEAKTFWGYSDKAWLYYGYEKVYKDCALSGLFSFLNGEYIENAYNYMIDYINQQIDMLYKINAIAASTLLQNREALILKGEINLTLFDFINQE